MYRIDNRESVIREIQKYLRELGYRDIPILENGMFDRNTRLSVLRFQEERSLPKTGIVDYETFQFIYEEYLRKKLKDEIARNNPFRFKFPIKVGDRSESVFFINQTVAKLLDSYGYPHRIQKSEYFSEETKRGVVQLLQIFGLEGDGSIDEELYLRLLDERDSFENFNGKYR